jgi:hypothetical protein
VLSRYKGPLDERLFNALLIAKEWVRGNASVGDARNASVAAHALARELSNSTSIAVARSVGHAVATAHMADHSLGAASYALKAVKHSGQSIEMEREWQNEQLSSQIRELVLSTRDQKDLVFKDLRYDKID